jgi:phosphohistidine phosphatase SixA
MRGAGGAAPAAGPFPIPAAARRRIAGLFSLLALLASAPAAAQTAVFVVRHAEKASDSSERDVPLSDEGRARADRLAALLRDAGINAIYATDTVRAKATAEPLARATGRTARIYSDVAVLADQLKGEPGAVALVVGHSNTVPKVLAALGVRASIEIGDREYDDLFVVVPRATGEPYFARLRY